MAKFGNIKGGPGLTMREVARLAGVSHPVVSAVLNENFKSVKVSEKTRERVLRVVRECGYYPNAVGRALSTRRTGHIGFILSDTIADGLANVYYANCLAGIEDACRRRGYSLNISLYNLSNIDSFVFPPKVGQRAVDGLILGDCIEAAVLTKFREFGLPFVCIGDDVEVKQEIPAVVSDCIGHTMMCFRYLAKLGHRCIGYHSPVRRRALEFADVYVRMAAEDPELAGCSIKVLTTSQRGADYDCAKPVLTSWLTMRPADRPTAIFANYQIVLALLKEMHKHGLECPRDISLISGLDTKFCELTEPAITCVRQDMAGLGRMAARLLLDHVEGVRELEPRTYTHESAGILMERESVRRISDV